MVARWWIIHNVQEPLIKKEKPFVQKSEDVNKSAMYKACVYKAREDGKKDPEGFCKMEMEKVDKAELGGPKQKEMGARTYRDTPDHEAGNVLATVSRNVREKLQEKMGHKKEVAVYQKSNLDKSIEKMRDMSGSFEKARNVGIEGVHKPIFETRAKEIGHGKDWGSSPEGTSTAHGRKQMGVGGEKEEHKRVLGEIRGMKKPNLPKSESVDKTLSFGKSSPMPGQNYSGMKDREKDMNVEDSKNLKQSPNWSAHKVMPLVHQERRDEALKFFNQRNVKKSESIDWEDTKIKPSRILKR